MRIRASIRIRNAAMIDRRREVGLSQIALADLVGSSTARICQLEKLDYSSPKALAVAERVAAALEIDLEEILPEELKGKRLDTDLVRDLDVCASQVASFRARHVLPSPDTEIEAAEEKDGAINALFDAMGRLTAKQRRVLEMRFGLGGQEPKTNDEVGEALGVSRERVRQIQRAALMRLRVREEELARKAGVEWDDLDRPCRYCGRSVQPKAKCRWCGVRS